MSKHSPRWIALQKIGALAIIGILFISMIPVHATITGPFGTPQLNLLGANMINKTAPLIDTTLYWVNGSLSISGSWYYVNNSQTKTTTTASNSTTVTSVPGFGSGTNTNGNASATATASASASASSSSKVTTTTTVTIQTDIPAPLKLYGYVTFYLSDGSTGVEPLTFSGGQNGYYYVGETADFTSYNNILRLVGTRTVYGTLYIVAVNPANNETVGAPLATSIANSKIGGAPIDIYNAIVALPQFNDTMLGAYATKPSQAYPALPLAPYYNLIAIVGIMVLIPLAFLDLITPDKKANTHNVMAKIVIGVLVILLFPYIYDHIAYMLNTLNQMIIAYPANFQFYNAKLANLEADLIFPSSINPLILFATAIMFIGYVVVTLILWIMNYILGTVRILLIAGMIIMFPLSLALRDFYYTAKLGRMIEDTLFGLMLATMLSSVMLGVAEYLLSNWNSVDNMFRLAGIQPQWVAISAVLGALLAPTVLAPLVSTVYMATTEVASVAGGVAVAMGMSAASGGISGAFPSLAGGATGGAGATGMSRLARLQAGLIGAGRANLGTIATLPGVAAGMGGRPSALRHHELKLLKIINP